jgi:3-oxoacyl-[acyl-carrier-protein] synthase III
MEESEALQQLQKEIDFMKQIATTQLNCMGEQTKRTNQLERQMAAVAINEVVFHASITQMDNAVQTLAEMQKLKSAELDKFMDEVTKKIQRLTDGLKELGLADNYLTE